MGVSITGYRRLKKEDVIAGEDYPIDPVTRISRHDLWRAYVNPDFPGRADDLEHRAYYSYAEVVEGLQRSYGGYSIWRNELAQLAGWPEAPEEGNSAKRSHAASAWAAQSGPFWELINFADNEGAIGAAVCAKLAKDFAEFQSNADLAHPFFRECYDGMRRACEAAADGGAIDFS